MPIKYKSTTHKEYFPPTFEAETPTPEPEIQNEEIIVEPSPEPSKEIPKYEIPEVEDRTIENEWEFGEEDARNIAMIIVSIASLFPYWPEKKMELEEKYGSIEEFRAQYETNLQKAFSHPWVKKMVRNISWLQHLTLLPFIFQTFELFSPPQRRKNVEIPNPTSQSTSENIYVPQKQPIAEGAFTIHD
jgi:hypothetical protein